MTTITKGLSGYRAASTFPMSNGLTLKVSTHKLNNGALATTASCCKVNGNFETHRVYQDYYVTLIKEAKRCTEKNVSNQHLKMLNRIAEIKSDAEAHYANPDYIAKHGIEAEAGE